MGGRRRECRGEQARQGGRPLVEEALPRVAAPRPGALARLDLRQAGGAARHQRVG
ncbi:hypothetical protein T484DRAFT_1984662 [Baffinella frigidus]|nr:hypothetical protein T484DRAFT_1984662 [Cryptophyta sp. CCMP2293]